VRPQGKVEPARVKDDLPRLVEIARKAGLKTEMMVTAIEKPDQLYTREILETAAALGVKHYRTAWFKYDLTKSVEKAQQEFAAQLRLLAQLNQSLGIQGGYQNHSGTSFGSAVWDLWSALKDLPVEFMGAQYDVRHAMVEGANSWIVGLNLIKNNISSLAIKDFKWEIKEGKASVTSVPLGEGLIDFDLYFKTIKELNIVAPITLHIEYPMLSDDEEKLSLTEKQKILIPKIRHDVDFVRNYLDKYEIR
jgi:sugar phosphate isomerase/epimerase